MTRNLLTKLRATNSWPRNGTERANGAAYPKVAAGKSFYTERSGVPPQPSPSPDRAPDAQAAGPVPLTLARGRGAAAKPPRHLADLPMAGRRAAIADLGQPAFRAGRSEEHTSELQSRQYLVCRL